MSPIALNRKNALFAGHDQRARELGMPSPRLSRPANCMASIRKPIFADVLTKLVNLWPASRLDELMPWAWSGVAVHRSPRGVSRERESGSCSLHRKIKLSEQWDSRTAYAISMSPSNMPRPMSTTSCCGSRRPIAAPKHPDPLRTDPVATVIDSCVGCGLCGEVAHAAVLCPSFYRVELIRNPTRWDRLRDGLSRGVIRLFGGRDRPTTI